MGDEEEIMLRACDGGRWKPGPLARDPHALGGDQCGQQRGPDHDHNKNKQKQQTKTKPNRNKQNQTRTNKNKHTNKKQTKTHKNKNKTNNPIKQPTK